MTVDISVPMTMDLTWRYASGAAMERFCRGLLERRIEALRCDDCGRSYLPPRPMCGNCHVRLQSWVSVANEGVLEAWTLMHVPALDGRTGTMRPVPYAMGLIRLDGADTTLNHFLHLHLHDADLGLGFEIGQRVRAVWREELLGAMDDILHFEVVR